MARFHKRVNADGTVERVPFTAAEEAQRDAEEAAWADGTAKGQVRLRAQAQRETRLSELKAKEHWSAQELEEAVRLVLGQ